MSNARSRLVSVIEQALAAGLTEEEILKIARSEGNGT